MLAEEDKHCSDSSGCWNRAFGPESGFAELFRGRWCILIPLPETAAEAVTGVTRMWERVGMWVVTMSADHHDKVLAVTSHLPHLIAYTIVGTATDLEDSLKSEVIEFSASGFRDFTRIAASDPVMAQPCQKAEVRPQPVALHKGRHHA